MVFSGSVRKNLDPTGACSNSAIATALQQAGLQEWAAGLEVSRFALLAGVRDHGEYVVLLPTVHCACRWGWIQSCQKVAPS